MFFKRGILSIIVVMLVIFTIGCSGGGDKSKTDLEDMGDVVAKVNDVEIYEDKLQDTVEKMLVAYQQQEVNLEGEEGERIKETVRQNALDNLIREEVLLQEAENKGYNVSDEAVDEEFEKIKAGFPSEEEFNKAIEANQFTEESFKTTLSKDMKIQQLIDHEVEEVNVTEEETKVVYDQYKEQWEAQKEESEEELQEMPPYEKVKGQLENEIKQQKRQEQIQRLIDSLMEKSEIETFI